MVLFCTLQIKPPLHIHWLFLLRLPAQSFLTLSELCSISVLDEREMGFQMSLAWLILGKSLLLGLPPNSYLSLSFMFFPHLRKLLAFRSFWAEHPSCSMQFVRNCCRESVKVKSTSKSQLFILYTSNSMRENCYHQYKSWTIERSGPKFCEIYSYSFL